MSNLDPKTPPNTTGPDTVACPDCGHVNPAWRSRCEKCDQALKAGVAKKTGKFKKPEKNAAGLCQKCGDKAGSPYLFYYLKREITSKTTRLSNYRLGGSEEVPICDACVKQYRNRTLVTFGLFVVFFLFMCILGLGMFIARMSVLHPDFGFLETIYLIGGGLGGVYTFAYGAMLVKIFRGGLKFSGTSLSIDLWKGWLKEQNFDTFLTDEEYEKLKAQP